MSMPKEFKNRKWITRRILPIRFECPHCGQTVERKNDDGSLIGCGCIEVSYGPQCLIDGIAGIIPTPDEILPRKIEGQPVDAEDIIEEASFRWGRLVVSKK